MSTETHLKSSLSLEALISTPCELSGLSIQPFVSGSKKDTLS
jgi:hypothetical protein